MNFEILIQNKDQVIQEFYDKYLVSNYLDSSSSLSNLNDYFSQSLDYLSVNNVEKFKQIHKNILTLHIELNTPYVVFINEINNLKHIIVNLFISHSEFNIATIYKLYDEIENEIAKSYLELYITHLSSACNVRLANLGDMVEKNVIDYYVSHLKWLLKLSKSVHQENVKSFPLTDPTLCEFGKWLHVDASKIIKNSSKLKYLVQIHNQLHLICEKIRNIITNDLKEYNILLTYLERCELISLSIGTELALIDNTIVNQKSAKDPLTGALSRQVLQQIFRNQYDISLATNSNFIVAMCDLDYFKNINDTYGHIAGDKMLLQFVNIVKKELRASDIIIRYGGEEFLLILPALDYDIGKKVLNTVCHTFEKFILKFENNQIKTTVSIGMVEIEAKQQYSENFLEEYISIADKRLYQAKHNGKNQVI